MVNSMQAQNGEENTEQQSYSLPESSLFYSKNEQDPLTEGIIVSYVLYTTF